MSDFKLNHTFTKFLKSLKFLPVRRVLGHFQTDCLNHKILEHNNDIKNNSHIKYKTATSPLTSRHQL